MYVCTSRWLPYVCLHKSLFPKIVDVRHHATVPLRRIHRDQPNAYRFDFAWRDADPITPGCSESEDTPPREADIILQDRCLPVPPPCTLFKASRRDSKPGLDESTGHVRQPRPLPAKQVVTAEVSSGSGDAILHLFVT